MSQATVPAPPGAGAATFLLTVRGKAKTATTEEARTLHNSTAGDPAAVATPRPARFCSSTSGTACPG